MTPGPTLARLWLVALLALAAPAAAQQSSTNIAPPPEKFAVSPGGVDMRSGRYAYSQSDLAIAGEAGLSLTRTLTQQVPGHTNPFANFSHNWDVLAIEKRINIDQGNFTNLIGQPDYQIEIAFGGRSQTFRAGGNTGPWELTSRAGYAILTQPGSTDRASAAIAYTYTSGDGSVAVFRPMGSADCSTVLRCAYIASLTDADGTRLDFSYDSTGSNQTRLRSVVSSRGYALLLEYSGVLAVKACALNLASASKPAGNVCPADALATASYVYDGNGKLSSVTDAANRVWGFVNTQNSLGFVKPGFTAPWLTNSFTLRGNDDGLVEDIVDRQDFADGTFYNYAWGETPFMAGHVSSIAGGMFTDSQNRTTQVRFDFPVKPYVQAGTGHGSIGGEGMYEPASPIVYQVTPRPAAVTDPLGRVTASDYCDPLAAQSLPPQQLDRCVVTPMPVSVTDPDGIQTLLTNDYVTRNLLKTEQVPRPGSPAGLPHVVRQATYDCQAATIRSCSKPLTVTDPRLGVTTFTYAAEHGGVLTETHPAVPVRQADGSFANVAPQTRYEYVHRTAWLSNGAGGYVRAASEIWLLSATSSCRRSAATGNPAAPCTLAGDEVRTLYDYGPDAGPNNLLLRGTVVSADGASLRTCHGYDPLGRKVSETRPGAGLAACPAGAPSSPAPFTTGYRYDSAGEETGIISPDPDGAGPLPFPAVRKTYDQAGRLVKAEEGRLAALQSEAVAPAAWSGFTIDRTTAIAYDVMDRKLRDVVSGDDGAAAGVTDYSYDSSGRLLCTAARMNPASWGTAPVDACTATSPGNAGPDRVSRNSYDAADQLLKVEKGVLTPLRQDYATYEYDLDGRQSAVIDANGNRAELRYDGLGRESCWIFPSKTNVGALGGDCATGDFEAYTYDVAGNRTSLRKRDTKVLTYAYDPLNRPTQKSVPQSASGAAGYDVFYAYDLRGLETEARFGSANGPGIANAYDGFGRQTAATTNMDGTARTLTSTYDAESNRIALTGDAAAWGYASASSYDGLDRLTGLNEMGHPVAQLGYDPAGRRSSLGLGFDGTSSSAAYRYDPAGRLQSLSHDLAGTASDQALTFGYNATGQIITRTSSNDAYASNTALAVSRAYAVNGLNQYTGTTSGGTPSATFSYDANGNLTSDGSNNYVYDAENRLVSASGGHNATLGYDPLGRLWQVASPTATTRFLYDGDRLAIEYDGANTLLRAYAHGAGVDEPLVWYEAVPGGVSRRYLHADHQGSIIAVADQNGNPIAINAYDSWGIPNAGNLGRFGYTGQTWLPELGLWYYKARLYSPTLGRFLQTDPVGYKDQVNLYAYVGNDPVDGRDPTGAYDCDKQDCEGAAKYAGQIARYMQSLRERKKLDVHQRSQLRKGEALLKFLGSQNDHNGVTIANNSNLESDTPGQTSMDDKGRITIELNYSMIDSMNRQDIAGGGILGHELVHGYEFRHLGQITSYNVQQTRERNAYTFQFRYERNYGKTDPRTVEQAATQSCTHVLNQDYGDDGVVSLGGHCQ